MAEEKSIQPTYERQDVGELPGIHRISRVIEWIHELFLAVSALLLTTGVLLAGIDLATGGSLTAQFGNIVVIVGSAVSIGCEAQIFALLRRASQAYRMLRYWQMTLWGAMSIFVLAYGMEIMAVYTAQSVTHVDETTALAYFGMTPLIWSVQRGVVSIVLLAFVAISMYARPPKIVETAAYKAQKMRDEAMLLEAQLPLIDAQARVRAAQARSAAGVMAVAGVATREAASQVWRGKSTEAPALAAASYEEPEPEPPTPPTKPRRTRKAAPAASDFQLVGRSVGSHAFEDESRVPVELSGRANAGKRGRPRRPQYDKQLKRVVEMVRQADERELATGRPCRVQVRAITRDKYLSEQGIAPSLSQAPDLLAEAFEVAGSTPYALRSGTLGDMQNTGRRAS